MNAKDLRKKSLTAKEIFEEISNINELNPEHFKFFIPHFRYVSNDVQVELSKMGFKLTHGEWFRGDYGLIIEW
jgi:hypothetical protein